MKSISRALVTVSVLAPSYAVALNLPFLPGDGHGPGHGHDDDIGNRHHPHRPPKPPVVSPTISAPPTPTCTLMLGPPKPVDVDTLTCTKYASTTTVTAYTECKGCDLQTFSLGPGPVINCPTRITLPLATETHTVCSVDTEGPPPLPTVSAPPPISIPQFPFPIPLTTATDFPPSFPVPSFLSAIFHPHLPFHQAEKKDVENVEEVEDGLYARENAAVDPGQETIPFTTDVILNNLVGAIMWTVSALLKGQGVSTAGILPTTITDPLNLILTGAVNPFGGTPLGPPYTSPIHDPGSNPGQGNGNGNGNGKKAAAAAAKNKAAANYPPVKQAPLEMLDHYLAALKEFLSKLPQNYQNSNEGKAVVTALKQFMAAVKRFTTALEKGENPDKAGKAFVKAIKAIAEELNKVHTQGPGGNSDFFLNSF